jgi:hypothetical protein
MTTAWDDFWKEFWKWAQTPLGATIVGGLIVVAIGFLASFLVARVRQVRWTDSLYDLLGRLFHAGEWLWERRPRSNMRLIEAGKRAAAEARSASIESQRRLAETNHALAQEKARTEMHANRAEAHLAERKEIQQRLSERDEELKQVRATLEKEIYEKGLLVDIAKGSSEELKTRFDKIATLEKQLAVRNAPRPDPRWHIGVHGKTAAAVPFKDALEFHLANGVANSVALGVRVDGQFLCKVIGDGNWVDLSGKSKETFIASVESDAYAEGVTFVVSWFDSDGVKKSESFDVDAGALFGA